MVFLGSATTWAMGLFVVAVVSLLVSLRQGRAERRRITCRARVVPLLSKRFPDRLQAAGINVSVDFADRSGLSGMSIRNARVIELAVRSRSRRGIPRKDFDGGCPLVVKLGTSFAKAIEVFSVGYSDHLSVDAGEVVIGPCLIRRGPIVRILFLTDGPPKITWENPLVDVDVRSGRLGIGISFWESGLRSIGGRLGPRRRTPSSRTRQRPRLMPRASLRASASVRPRCRSVARQGLGRQPAAGRQARRR